MFQVVSFAELVATPSLRESMLRHRAVQFVDRHGWKLQLTGALEIDAFDRAGTGYCVLSHDSRHVASIRLRHAADGSMVEQHFPAFWNHQSDLLRDLPEVTRLCIAPRSAPEWCREALGELLLGLCCHCLRTGIDRFFGVVYPSVARSLERAGWTPEILEEFETPDGRLLLATWRVSHRVHWDLQAMIERRQQFSDWPSARRAA